MSKKKNKYFIIPDLEEEETVGKYFKIPKKYSQQQTGQQQTGQQQTGQNRAKYFRIKE